MNVLLPVFWIGLAWVIALACCGVVFLLYIMIRSIWIIFTEVGPLGHLEILRKRGEEDSPLSQLYDSIAGDRFGRLLIWLMRLLVTPFELVLRGASGARILYYLIRYPAIYRRYRRRKHSQRVQK